MEQLNRITWTGLHLHKKVNIMREQEAGTELHLYRKVMFHYGTAEQDHLDCPSPAQDSKTP
jgi:hypothetical protein